MHFVFRQAQIASEPEKVFKFFLHQNLARGVLQYPYNFTKLKSERGINDVINFGQTEIRIYSDYCDFFIPFTSLIATKIDVINFRICKK